MILSPRSLLFWSSVVCCLVAQVLIVRSVLGARTAGPRPELTRSRDAVELVWALAPAVALGVLLWFTWQAIRRHEALDVRVSAPVMEAAR